MRPQAQSPVPPKLKTKGTNKQIKSLGILLKCFDNSTSLHDESTEETKNRRNILKYIKDCIQQT
jgi:hypothetical protein